MGLFKRAAARGVAHELVRRGVVSFPSKQAADEAADAVADSMPEEKMPEISPEQGHAPDALAEIANKLMELSAALMAQSGGGAPGPGGEMPPLPPEVAKAASELYKTAAAADLETLASEVAVSCMDKAAAETKQANSTGTLVTGGGQQNTPATAAKNESVAALDAKQRPEGAYHEGMGNTKLDTDKGQVAHIGTPTVSPSNSPAGTNSVNSGAKSASLLSAELKKVASKLVGLHTSKDKNSPESAAKTDAVAALDLKQRPPGKYLVGQGKTNFSEPQSHRVGKEAPAPEAPSNSPSGTNSVMQASKAASELDEEEQAFVTLFKKCAADVGSYLPAQLSEDEKIAAISQMIGFDQSGRQAHLDSLYSKVASMDESKNKGAAGDEEKKDAHNAHSGTDHDKYKRDPKHNAGMVEQKKESALLGEIRKVAASATQSRT